MDPPGYLRILATSVLGLIYVFAGYHWIRMTTRLASALLFAAIAGGLAREIASPWLLAGIAMTAGLLGFLLGNVLYFLIVFLYGAAAGALLASAPGELWILVAGAAAGGTLTLLFERPLAIAASALLGAFLLAGLIELAVAGAFPRTISPLQLGPAALVGWAALSALGILVQATTAPDVPPR